MKPFDLQQFAGSGAGANRWGHKGGVHLLTCPPGANVTYDSGIWAVEAGFFTTWTFQCVRQFAADTLNGWTVTIYGTIDPRAFDLFYPGVTSGITGGSGIGGTFVGGTGLDTYSWVVLPGPSEQSGTGAISNPMIIASGQSPSFFQFKGIISALRVVASSTGGGTPTGTLVVLGAAGP